MLSIKPLYYNIRQNKIICNRNISILILKYLVFLILLLYLVANIIVSIFFIEIHFNTLIIKTLKNWETGQHPHWNSLPITEEMQIKMSTHHFFLTKCINL